jgi:stress response protein YsnF
MDIYEETPDIYKEAVVREEVRVKKVVEHDTAEAQEKIRREELDIDADGRAIKDKRY